MVLSRHIGKPSFIVPGCTLQHDALQEEGAKDAGEASEEQQDDKQPFAPDDLLSDVYHALMRIVGSEILDEVFVLPDRLPPGVILEDEAAGGKQEKDAKPSEHIQAAGTHKASGAEVRNGKREIEQGEEDVKVDGGNISEALEAPNRPSTPKSAKTTSVGTPAKSREKHRAGDPRSDSADYHPPDEMTGYAKSRRLSSARKHRGKRDRDEVGELSFESLEHDMEDEEEDEIKPVGKKRKQSPAMHQDAATQGASNSATPRRKHARRQQADHSQVEQNEPPRSQPRRTRRTAGASQDSEMNNAEDLADPDSQVSVSTSTNGATQEERDDGQADVLMIDVPEKPARPSRRRSVVQASQPDEEGTSLTETQASQSTRTNTGSQRRTRSQLNM